MRRITTTLLGVAVLATAACQDDVSTLAGPEVDAELSRTATGPAGLAGYEVTVTNLTGGQPLTPPLAVTHRRPIELFEIGEAATLGVREIAENGNLAPLNAAVSADAHVASVVIAAGSPPPILPGASRTFTIETERGAKYLSFVSMLICTNDGFTGLQSVRLPRDVGESDAYDAMGYDAGSEINTEDFADMVPPCPALTGVPSMDPGTGTSDPALAEGDVIRMHPGVLGVSDLDPAIHGWSGAVARIEVKRVN